ncbi:MAG TPA: mechanosensitive ion channel domain-containing protein [Steroidobacteraceae bacterium]|jgi:small-conductance mechanosensitive channel|nr:mechanosensitive ion channel domain-containing protein [Steroidobacteraceae bacterium]
MREFDSASMAVWHEWMSALFGTRMSTHVLGSITWADIALSCTVVLLILIANATAVAVIRHKRRSAASTAKLRHHALGALRGPLYLLIWICGGYMALAPLLAASPLGTGWLLALLRTLLNLGIFAVAFWFCFRFTRVLEARLAAWAAHTSGRLDDLLVPLLGRGLRVILPVLAIIFALPILGLPAAYAGIAVKGSSILLIVAITAVLFQAVTTVQEMMLLRFDITAHDNLRARKLYTQVHVLGRVVYVAIGVFAVACILMLFQQVRHVGTSLLASAGIMGIIAGVAGQKTLANLIAGFQIALAQPIRLDDVVIVEGEWGRIEEITLSYVVVHIWDDRRLVLPLTYFVEKPFQNWTRNSAQLMGSVFVWVDYSFPLEEGRKALGRIIESSPLWDRRFWNLQVSDTSERTMQLRVLATSEDSSKSWNLRCEIREKFIAYIQEHHPGSLPLVRAHVVETQAPPLASP